MKPPELLATITHETLVDSKTAVQDTVSMLRQDGILGADEALTWVLSSDHDRYARLYRGAVAPPHKGAIVQIVPGHHWGSILVVVDEVKSFGIQAYHLAPLAFGVAPIRLDWADFELTGGHVVFEPALLART
jgi:hypothetical protein